MNYLTATQRVEMALPAHLMLAVLLGGADSADPGPQPQPRPNEPGQAYVDRTNDWLRAWEKHQEKRKDPAFEKSYQEFCRTRELLMEACLEPVKDVYPAAKQASLMRRIERLHFSIIKPYTQISEPDPRKIGLIAFYLIDLLVSTSYLIIPESSSFGMALEIMLPGLSPSEGSTPQEIAAYDKLNASAQKQLRHVLHKLQSEGYYLGLELPF